MMDRPNFGAKFWVWIAVIMPTAIMMPVLLWPHYGLFSDAGQAITFPREVLANFPHSLALLRPLDDGRWNPIFHGFTILIYFLAPDSARALYIFQWLMLVGTCINLAWIIFRFSNSNKLAILSVILFCCGSAVLENFFTLDKVEPRLAFFSSLILSSIACNLLIDRQANKFFGYIAFQLLAGVLLVFSKETGYFLVAALIGTWFACLLNPHWGSRARNLIGITALIQFAVVLLFAILFKILSGDLNYRYVTYHVSPDIIFNNLRYYVKTSPELLLGIMCASYWSLGSIWRRLPGPIGRLRIFLVLVSMALLSYVSGLCLWRWHLEYYILPGEFLASMLLALTAYVIQPYASKHKSITKVFIASLFLVWVIFLPKRILNGFVIYSQDAIKDQVATLLSNKEWQGSRLILPFGHPDSAEVGERLEFFINSQRSSEDQVDLYNFWESPLINRDNFQRFSGGAGIAPTARQLKEVAIQPQKYVIWKFGGGSNALLESQRSDKNLQSNKIRWVADESWRASYLQAGDLILVPTGELSLGKYHARGIAMHAQRLEDFLRKTPIKLKRVGGVVNNGWGPYLGWDLLRVEKIDEGDARQPFSLALLFSTNILDDITPPKSTEILFGSHNLPDQGLLLGGGWYGVEGQKTAQFRWMGPKTEVLVTKAKAGSCSLDIDVEPILLKESPPFALQLNAGGKTTSYSLEGRKNIHFEFIADAQPIQVIHLTASGGMISPPPGDSRLLKARIFYLRISGECVTLRGVKNK